MYLASPDTSIKWSNQLIYWSVILPHTSAILLEINDGDMISIYIWILIPHVDTSIKWSIPTNFVGIRTKASRRGHTLHLWAWFGLPKSHHQRENIWLVVSTPLKNQNFSWDHYYQSMEKSELFQTTNQIECGYNNAINHSWLWMVNIPPIKMVMTVGWFMTLFSPF